MPTVDFKPEKHQKFEVDGELWVVDKDEYPDFWNQFNAADPETEYVLHQVNIHDVVIHHADEPTRNLFKKKKKDMEQVGDKVRAKRK